MLFQRINRTDPEKVFVIVKNGYSTSSLVAGYPVVWEYTNDKDGISVTKPPASGTSGLRGGNFAGVITQTIAYGDYGLCQVYGYNSDCLTRLATTGSDGVEAGCGLRLPTLTGFVLESLLDTGILLNPHPTVAIALTSHTLWTATATKVFIKAM